MINNIFEGAKKSVQAITTKQECAREDCKNNKYIAELYKCGLCQLCFCNKCISSSKKPIPSSLLPTFAVSSNEQIVRVDDWLCQHVCEPITINYWMNNLKEEMSSKYHDLVMRVINNEIQQFFYSVPDAIGDSAYRTALRIGKSGVIEAVEIAATLTGLQAAYIGIKALKYAFYSNELITLVIGAELVSILEPLASALYTLGVSDKGSTAILNLYYICCKYELDFNCNPDLESKGFDKNDDGVVESICPPELLDLLGEHLAPAMWLYASLLHAPHNTTDHSSWYLSRMAARQGWTVIACLNETTRLPNDTKCPGFALVTKYLLDSTTGKTKKIAMLVIRGTRAALDWSINAKEEPTPFVYYRYQATSGLSSTKEECNSPTESVPGIEGYVHTGMYQATTGILDTYGMRGYLTQLYDAGFDIRITGHSMGAGVASVAVMELRNGFLLSSNPSRFQSDRLLAVSIACPPCVTTNIADALVEDRLVYTVTHGHDIIPRLTYQNLSRLATEMQTFEPQAMEWYKQDKESMKKYAASCGKLAELQKLATEPDSELSSPPASASASAPSPTSSTRMTSMEITTIVPAVTVVGGRSMGARFTDAVVNAVTPVTITATNVVINATNAVTVSASNAVKNAVAPVTVTANVTATAIGSSVSTSMQKMSTTLTSVIPTIPNLDKKDIYADMVVPGIIVHFYRCRGGKYKASVIQHSHPTLKELRLVPSAILRDHDMATHFLAMRSVRQRYKLDKTNSGSGGTIKPSPRKSILLSDAASLTNTTERELVRRLSETIPPDLNLFRNNDMNNRNVGTRTSTTSVGGVTVDGKVDMKNEDNSITAERESSQSENSVKQSIEDMNSTKSNPSIPTSYTSTSSRVMLSICTICQNDVTWPYITHGDATRGGVTHYCGLCQRVVCTICSPAGDKIPGEGWNTTVQLRDWRLVVPSTGMLTPC